MDDAIHTYRFELRNIGPVGPGRGWFLVTCTCDGEPDPDFEPRTVCLADADIATLSRRVCEQFRHLDLRIGIVRELH